MDFIPDSAPTITQFQRGAFAMAFLALVICGSAFGLLRTQLPSARRSTIAPQVFAATASDAELDEHALVWSRRNMTSLLCSTACAILCGAPQFASAEAPPSSLMQRCIKEESINGAYFQGCMGDAERIFQWPSVGRIAIEQGPIGPSNTGETLWNAAVLLADHMATTLGPDYFRGKRVIELGCGTALPSIVASKLGAEVLATDLTVEVISRAQRNVQRNGAQAKVQRLSWGRLLDGDYDGLDKFDIVLASDVLWVLGSWKPLAVTARELLTKDGDFLLAETGHDQLPLPAALAGYRTVAESAGLVIDEARTVPLQLKTDGFDAQLLVAHRR